MKAGLSPRASMSLKVTHSCMHGSANTTEEWLHCGVLYCRAEEHRRELQQDGHTPDRCGQLCVGRERIVKEKVHDIIINFCNLFNQLGAFLGGQLEHGSWELIGFNNVDAM